MKSPEYYRGREQTYVKHFFLERYIERVAYNIGSFSPEFAYVDGFSGPWRAEGESLEDTSFMIAINKLRQVREGLAKAGKQPRVRCLFIEKDANAFARLEQATADVQDMDVRALRGEFEEVIPDVLRFVGSAFALVFIDPTGWTGFGLRRIAPILQHRPGEVLVNFMFDYINRFLDAPRTDITDSFSDLFGGPGWEAAVRAGGNRESAIVDLYLERMRNLGKFEHVTFTRILQPTRERAYFYLIYGTRHWKGLVEFRKVESEAVEEQERVRLAAKQEKRIEQSRQFELFPAAEMAGPPSFERERASRLDAARGRLDNLLAANRSIPYERALASLLELPLVWKKDVDALIADSKARGRLEVQGMTDRERTPKPGYVLVPIPRQ